MSNTKLLPSLLNNELKFLITCCQEEASQEELSQEEPLEEINCIPNDLSTINHQLLISIANQHGILPIVYKTIKDLSTYDQPATDNQHAVAEILSELKVHYMRISQSNISMSVALIKIMKLLQESDIEALAFKGPSLSQMAYKDITLRQFGDLDILIKRRDIEKVEALCRSLGYIPYLTLTNVQKEFWYSYAKDMVFYHPEKKSYLEMHWLLLDADYPLQVDLDLIWNETQSVALNKHPVQTFSSESLLLYLCIHGSKHLWERIIWVKDIDLMIRTQNIDLQKTVLRSEENDSKRMLFLGLYLSQTLFDTALPKNIQELLEKEKVLPELSHFVFANWKSPISMFQNTRAMLKFFPTLKMKTQYLHKTILKPSRNEYQYIDLPKGLHWFYYLIRPYLLIKKYLKLN